MSSVSVLIVGAGPTGLLLASELARHDIDFRIIDRRSEQTRHSNAVGVQARTLEILKQIGIIDEFLSSGQKCHALNFYSKSKVYASLNLDCIDSIYPFVLALPQSQTEKILNEHLGKLGHQVERSLDLIDVEQKPQTVSVTTRHKDVDEDTIECDWLIACDGAHSTIREKVNISFPGEDISEQFVVADAQMQTSLSANEIHIFSDNGALIGVFPYGSNQFRIGANLDVGYAKKFYSEKEVQEIIAKRTSNLFQANQVSWISPFWIHSKLANRLNTDRVFLAGDAAHIHSPLGGQGMNTGLQDAKNLAWKLALVVKGRANTKLLGSYQDERYPVVANVVKMTDRATKMQLVKSPLINLLRRCFIKIGTLIPGVRKTIAMRLSQLDIYYNESPIIDYQTKFSKQTPRAGERAPDVAINESQYFLNHLDDTNHHIILFGSNTDSTMSLSQCQEIMKVIEPFNGMVKLHLVTPTSQATSAQQIHDSQNAIHQAYRVNKPSIFVIRPDGYIGFKRDSINCSEIADYLKKYLISN